MSNGNFDIFKIMASKLSWLGQRQATLSQNVANADTPGYRPFDIEPYSFKDALDKTGPAGGTLHMVAATSGQMIGAGDQAQQFSTTAEKDPYEVFPNGNGVVLEEQMVKASQNASDYQMTTGLYAQTISLYKMAIKAPA